MSDILGIEEAKKAIDLAFDLIRWITNKPVVKGKVVRRDKSTPVSQVTVYIGEKKQQTAQDGTFIIEGMGTGSKQIDFELDGERVPNMAQVFIKSRGSIITFKEPLVIPKQWTSKLPEISLEVEGCVLDSSNVAVGGAIIKFGDDYKATTARSGKFFVQISPGLYNISIEHNGVLYNNLDIARISWNTQKLEPILFTPEQEEGITSRSSPSVEESFSNGEDNLSRSEIVNSKSLTDQIRDFINDNYFVPALEEGKTQITIRAGDVHQSMNLENRYPAVCNALRGQKLQNRYNVKVINREGPENGSNVFFTFDLKPLREVSTSDKQTGSYPCPYCSTVGTFRHNLRKHLMGTKPYGGHELSKDEADEIIKDIELGR